MVGNKASQSGWLHARRWLFAAPTLLLLWIIGDIDQTKISPLTQASSKNWIWRAGTRN